MPPQPLQTLNALAARAAGPDCREVVTDNYGYFDGTLPRSAPQLLVLKDFAHCLHADAREFVAQRDRANMPHGCDIHVPIWSKLDWVMARGLLVP
jgi:hypothetical protein